MESQKITKHIIKNIEPGSIAEELELEPGDELLRINGNKIKDVFDYHYFINDESLTILVRKKNGEEWELEIEKDYEEDLGIEFEEGFMDSYKSCRNKCIFCFIDQMPPGMRETLYFKDDDARLSFLQGNYVTLTNMSEEDVERICFYKLSPINISIHTMNKELRCKMLNNRFAGEALEKINRFYDAKITMNGQIVLCKGYNDKEELEYSIKELSKYLPFMQSVSVVPVGMTKYRDGLTDLEKFTKEDAKEVIEIIERWQHILLKKHGTRMVHASDEWYLTANLEIPEASRYEGYLQLENGVGMIRSLLDEFEDYLKKLPGDMKKRQLSLATGVLAAPIMKHLAKRLKEKYPNTDVFVYPIINEFFGEDITVAGLLTGEDIIKQLKGKNLYDVLLLPSVLLRSKEDVLLDDYTIKDVENTLQTSIRIVQSGGVSWIDTVLSQTNNK